MSDDVDRAAAAIEELAKLHASTMLHADEETDLRQLLVAFGWWTRIVHTAQGIAAVHAAGVAHEAAPLVRALIHHSVALKWLTEFPDEVTEAITWEHGKQGARAWGRAVDRGWELTPDAGPQAPTDGAPPGYRYLTSMEDLCARASMANALVPLLIESKYAHPTGISADAYLADGEPPKEGELNIGLVLHPDAYAPLYSTALFAVDATVQFGDLANLPEMVNRATALRDEMIEVVRRSEGGL